MVGDLLLLSLLLLLSVYFVDLWYPRHVLYVQCEYMCGSE